MSSQISRRLSRINAFSLSRRRVLGVAMSSFAGLYIPEFAMAHPRSRKFQHVQITTDGGQRSRAVFSDLDNPPAPAVLLVHDHWGASASVRWVASELGRQGFLAIVPDLFDGKVVENENQGRQWQADLDPEHVLDVLTSWTRWLKAQFYSTGRVGTLAWGGGCNWSLQAAMQEKAAAAVLYYPEHEGIRESSANSSIPLMAHLDASAGMAEDSVLEGNGQWFQYSAKTGFADFIRSSFDADADAAAWKRTLSFLTQHLKR